MKRMVCMLLIAAMLMVSVPAEARGAEDGYRFGSIFVNFAGAVEKRQVMIGDGGQYYVPLNWLTYYGANITRLDLADHWEFYCTRQNQYGNFAKRVFIDKDGGGFAVGLYVNDRLWKKMKSGATKTPKRIYGDYYCLYSGRFSETYKLTDELWVPLAEVLPLINVEVSVSDKGHLCLLPVLMTTFDALHLYDDKMEDLLFDADEVVGNEVMTVGGWIISTTMDMRIDRLDVIWNTGRRNDYEKLFKDYLVDNEAYLMACNAESTPLQEHLAGVGQNADGIKSIYDTWEEYFDAIEMFENIESKPTGTKMFKGILEKTNSGVQVAVSLYEYAHIYCNQVEDHRLMLGSVYEYQKKPKSEGWPSYKAAMTVQKLYDTESVDALEAFDETVRDMANEWVKEYVSQNIASSLKPWFIAIEVTKVLAADSYQFVADSGLMGLVDNVVEYSRDIYKKRLHDCEYGAKDLNDLRLSAMMSMVASRHAFHVYWEGSLTGLEADIDEILAAFYTAGCYQEYDAADTHKNLKKQYGKMMDKLLCYEAPAGDLRLVEYGIVVATMQDIPMDDLRWTLNDADGDQNRELLIDALPDSGWRASQIVVDADSFVMDTHTAVGASQISEFVLLEGRDGWALSHGGASAMNGGDFYYIWTGDEWLLRTGIEWIVEETSAGTFIRTQRIYRDGVVVEEEHFDPMGQGDLRYDYPYWEAPTWDNPVLTDLVLQGEASTLMQQLDGYMDTRFGGLDSAREDINGDGSVDALYAIENAAGMWFNNISGLTEKDEPWAVFEDNKLTLVVAEAGAAGVRIRIQRLDVSDTGMDSAKDWSISGGILTLGDQEFRYSVEGDAFIPDNGVRDMSAGELEQFQIMFEQDHWYCQTLTSDYTTPAEIDVSQLFYNGYDGETAIAEERQYLMQIWGADDERLSMDLFRVSGSQMDDVLQTYFGLTRSDIYGEGIWNFTYLDGTDAYILAHTDCNYNLPQFLGGTWFGKDRVLLRYNWLGERELILEKVGSRWQVSSNMPILEGMG